MPEEADDYEALLRRNMALRRQVDHLSTLREIGLAISASLDVDETMRLIAEVVQGALDVRRLTIYELDREQGLLKPTIAKFGDDLITAERLEEEHVSPRGTPQGEAMSSHRVVLLNDAAGNAAHVPLIAKDEGLGVMVIENHADAPPFTRDDADLFRQLASQIGIAIGNAHLYALAVTDGLTRLFVRRYFDLRMEEEFAQAERYGRDFSLLLFDIDHFKKFNDTHGHQTGDLVLRQFAQLLGDNTRSSDICCRYGGEEMTVILPETGLKEAERSAENLCRIVREYGFEGTQGQDLHVTTSIGVASHDTGLEDAAQMVQAADEALYRAKESGRDRVCVAE